MYMYFCAGSGEKPIHTTAPHSSGSSGLAGAAPRQSVNGYDAYFGRYTIDETSHIVTHHLEGAHAAAAVDKNLVREFQLPGEKLVIIVRTNPPKEKQIRTLTWSAHADLPL